MARFIGRDEDEARALLAGAGVRILRMDDADAEEVLTSVLGAESAERGRIVAEPPADEAAAGSGMGAWHVNEVAEYETVLDGEGVVEFITADGAVSVLLTGGDVMVVERAEHRYRPLTAQSWVLRFGGPAGADLVASETGRESGPWPLP
jgi:hypothetical protein